MTGSQNPHEMCASGSREETHQQKIDRPNAFALGLSGVQGGSRGRATSNVPTLLSLANLLGRPIRKKLEAPTWVIFRRDHSKGELK